MLIRFLIGLLLCSEVAFSYPDFIGFGYNSCATCHYNPAGNGPLNDYGRSLFAAEIAAKPFWNPKADDEKLGEQSGFLGALQLPYWVRPGYKYRTLTVQNSPGSKSTESKNYQMQSDFSLGFFLDEDLNYAVMLGAGTASKEHIDRQGLKSINDDTLISREHYLKIKVIENTWAYLGFMDKAFGLRHPDHTAFNRSPLGLGQDDQTYGLMIHNVHETGELFIHPYLGNTSAEPDLRYSGGSLQYEYDLQEKLRIGASYLSESSPIKDRVRMAATGKMGIGEGNAVLFELGTRTDKTKIGKPKDGAYAYISSTIKLNRGLFFQSTGQYFKPDIKASGAEYFVWGLGAVYFPMQRLEFRLGAQTTRIINSTSVEGDEWAALSQLHLSL